MAWRTNEVKLDYLMAVLGAAEEPGWDPPAEGPELDSRAFRSGFCLDWVRAVLHAERECLVELWQRGSEGRVQMRLTELGRAVREKDRG